MIVGSLRGIFMIPPFYERLRDTAAEVRGSSPSPQSVRVDESNPG
jgi:hypothetical protein